MKILVADDEVGKRDCICDFLHAEIPNAEIQQARSFQSAIEIIRRVAFDLIVLDMRLTTYDASAAESGGRPRNFGGEEIMRKMTRRRIAVPVIILTQYTIFGDHGRVFSFEQIAERLSSDHENFLAMIHFSQSDNQWKSDLHLAIERLRSIPT